MAQDCSTLGVPRVDFGHCYHCIGLYGQTKWAFPGLKTIRVDMALATKILLLLKGLPRVTGDVNSSFNPFHRGYG